MNTEEQTEEPQTTPVDEVQAKIAEVESREARERFEAMSIDEKFAHVYQMQVTNLETLNQIGSMIDYLCQGTAGVFEAVAALKAQNFSPSALVKLAMGGNK